MTSPGKNTGTPRRSEKNNRRCWTWWRGEEDFGIRDHRRQDLFGATGNEVPASGKGLLANQLPARVAPYNLCGARGQAGTESERNRLSPVIAVIGLGNLFAEWHRYCGRS
jgi:hypothetical protein